ncbi:MAG: Bd3614 family nucleic acid deaminase, partial [Myxococcales bacterium]|nr:Bd3614 family nucleic acid deaminase [Myxococcales bacterium]
RREGGEPSGRCCARVAEMARRHHAPWVAGPEDLRLAEVFGPHTAWLPLPDGTVAHVRHLRVERTPRSPVLDLIQGVSRRWPDRAHALLRRRIRTTALAPFDAELVKVLARRVTLLAPGGGGSPEGVELAEDAAAARAHARLVPVAGEPMAALRALTEGVVGGAPGMDRPVGAVLVGPDGRLLAGARNQAGEHPSLHAEVALLQAWGAPIPAGCTLLVTLQCCRMCAALLVDAAPDLDVAYLEPDPGKFARLTALTDRERRIT